MWAHTRCCCMGMCKLPLKETIDVQPKTVTTNLGLEGDE